MKRFLPYLGRRAAFIIPQIFGVVAITFIVVRMVPGDPARLMGGPLVSEAGLELIRQKMAVSRQKVIRIMASFAAAPIEMTATTFSGPKEASKARAYSARRLKT